MLDVLPSVTICGHADSTIARGDQFAAGRVLRPHRIGGDGRRRKNPQRGEQ